MILDFSGNLENLFRKYTGQVVKLDERFKKEKNPASLLKFQKTIFTVI